MIGPRLRAWCMTRSISRMSCSKRIGLANIASALIQECCPSPDSEKSSPVSLLTEVTRITGTAGSSLEMRWQSVKPASGLSIITSITARSGRCWARSCSASSRPWATITWNPAVSSCRRC